ncbi:MAG: GNAT family N-acetyltransferase [Hydrogenophilales bacterium CG17_big_fil_post_rev_8_21_14_2_50_63_12]|nr:MAG: GNAT family N-acetyltransferase [Hydrogenophilales bacterium CG17_big_fil_post_rev_8_21_14_2_50_63_12]PIX96682.1 MAG: GNAT family N-acetyltransferase [Hydrogenophilales bacterium CG_4_10_14_3_um_filter_63_21]
MPSKPRLRAATEADLDAMTQLIARLFALEPDFSFDPARVRRGLGLLLSKKEAAALWVAEQDSQVIAMCSAQIVISTAEGGPVAWVEDLVVRPDQRGRGIGRLLLDAVTIWAKRRGLTRLQLLADCENETALGFYRHQGWQATRMICLRLRPGE